MKTIILGLTLGFISSVVVAQTPPCASIKQDQARLACYDKAAAKAPATPAPAAGPAAAPGKWSYSSNDDAMNGTQRQVASLNAENTIQLGFPYAGHNQPRLILRKNGKALDVMISVDKGQILCPLSECSVKVKFDDKAPGRYSGTGPADHSTTMLFLDPASKFIEQTKKSTTILVEINMYQAGQQLLKFNTGGLVWK
jgi:hypothetical protein